MPIILSHSTSYYLLNKGLYLDKSKRIDDAKHLCNAKSNEIKQIENSLSESFPFLTGSKLNILSFDINQIHKGNNFTIHYCNLDKYQVVLYPVIINNKIIPDVFICNQISTFLQLIQYLDKYQILKLMMEMTGCYYTYHNGDKTKFGNREHPLISYEELAEAVMSKDADNLKGIKTARRVLKYALPNSYSPMETTGSLMLTLPNCYGGEATKRPELNKRIELTTSEKRELNQNYIMSDMVWDKEKIVFEYDSIQEHNFMTKPEQVYQDKKRANVLTRKGYSVLSLDVGDFASENRIAELSKYLHELLGGSRRIRCNNFGYKHSLLFHELMNDNPWCMF